MYLPVFIFATGWRSGSTLLQRLITASGEVLVWGEAGGGLNCFQDAWERYRQMLGPGDQRFAHGYGGNGADEFQRFQAVGATGVNSWIACMNPPEQNILTAMRQMLVELYGKPAAALGYNRWGIKEVQSGIETARFMKVLFPEAKFVFLVRNPLSSLLSIKRRNWIDRADDKDPLRFFASHWKHLAREFRQADFGHLVRYEDLISNRIVVQQLLAYLELNDISQNFIQESHADWEPMNNKRLSYWERLRLKQILGSEMASYSYSME